MSSPLLQVRNLNVAYTTARGAVPAVQGVDLEVHRGQVTSIVGESGSGKSTTAMAVLGLLPDNARVESGEIRFEGRDLTTLGARQWREVRGPRIGLVPQDPNNSLNPVKKVGESVAEGLRIHRQGRDHRRRVVELLDRVGIDRAEKRYDQYPHELSGGMKQRALIAAALALEPTLLVADEPTSALDVTVQRRILDLLDEMRAELGLGLLFITHDLGLAGDRSDHVVVMQSGQVRERGFAAAVLTDPRDRYTQRLLADAPSLATAVRPRPAPAAAGTSPLLVVEGLRQEFGDLVAVDDVGFEVVAGTTHSIVGESGSGKTTTGRSIAAFNRPTAGSIRLADQEVVGIRGRGLRELRRSVQLVYQNPFSSLDPRQSVGESVAEPLRHLTSLGRPEIRERTERYLDLVALGSGMAARRPRELSGGQRQRVAIARALIVEPRLVVLDEAVSALDVSVQAQILRLLDELQRELELTYVFISHDLAVVRQISDTVSVMHAGRQVEQGPVAQIFEQPGSEYTRMLLDAIPGRRHREGDLNLGL